MKTHFFSNKRKISSDNTGDKQQKLGDKRYTWSASKRFMVSSYRITPVRNSTKSNIWRVTRQVFFVTQANSIKRDKKYLVTHQQIPVGGQLTHFLQKWREVTKDQFVLLVIGKGLKLDSNTIQIWSRIKKFKKKKKKKQARNAHVFKQK